MYKNKLNKNRVDINGAITSLFSGRYPNTYTNNSLNYFENLKKELEAHKTKKANILFRKNLLEHQNKINYTNELNRIRGEISRNDTRLPAGTIKHLKDRVDKLKKLGAQIVDEIK